MKVVLFLTALLPSVVSGNGGGSRGNVARPKLFEPPPVLQSSHRRSSLFFEPAEKGFVARLPGHAVSVRADSAVFPLGSTPVRMRVIGANQSAPPEGLEPLNSVTNYFIGNDPGQWRANIPHFGKIRYKNVYPGIDLLYYGTERMLEYDFIVSPGGSYSVIELAFEGAERIRTDEGGNLLIEAGGQTIRQQRPKVYELANGQQREIAGAYRLSGKNVQFEVARYHRRNTLVIDPVVEYSTYVGGAGYDAGVSITTDSAGASYITGVTSESSLLPTTSESAQRSHGGASDAFVAKFSAFGDLVWITYFGGRGTEQPLSIALDSAGNSYIAGWTDSQNLPLREPAQALFGGGSLDAFAAKISPAGNQLVYATYVGGASDDFGNGLAVDALGNAYLTGWTRSSNFPVRNGFQQGPAGGGADTFVTKIAPGGASFVYSTFVGGSGNDLATGIAVDAQGAAYVTGSTTSTVFPVVSAIQGALAGNSDAFLYKLNPAGNSLVYATFLGGSDEDLAYRVAVDTSGSAYVSGYTRSANYPVRSAFQPNHGGGVDVFLTKIAQAGNAITYSTFLGGSGDDYGFGNLAVDSANSVYLTGWTNSLNFPVRNAFQNGYGGGRNDAFIARLAPAGNALVYSSLLGGRGEDKAYGLAIHRNGTVRLTGHTDSPDFPKTSNSLSQGLATTDVFFASLSADANIAFAGASPARIEISTLAGAVAPPPFPVAITSTGSAFNFTAGGSAPWLRVTPQQGLSGSSINVTAEIAALPPGTYTADVTINAPAATNAPLIIPVVLTITAPPVSLTAAGVVSAATFQSGPIAPGQVITVFGLGFGPTSTVVASTGATGVLPTVLADTRLLIEDQPVPLLYVGAGQLSAIVPYSVASRPNVSIQVESQGRRSSVSTVAVAPAYPGIFTAGSSGQGQAAALNEDGTPNSAANSAARGSVVVLYATGEGALTPAAVEGRILPTPASPVSQVSVRVGGVPAQVLYAGTIPGSTPGVLQLNVRLPAEAPSGANVPVTLTIAGATSAIVTIAVQ